MPPPCHSWFTPIHSPETCRCIVTESAILVAWTGGVKSAPCCGGNMKITLPSGILQQMVARDSKQHMERMRQTIFTSMTISVAENTTDISGLDSGWNIGWKNPAFLNSVLSTRSPLAVGRWAGAIFLILTRNLEELEKPSVPVCSSNRFVRRLSRVH